MQTMKLCQCMIKMMGTYQSHFTNFIFTGSNDITQREISSLYSSNWRWVSNVSECGFPDIVNVGWAAWQCQKCWKVGFKGVGYDFTGSVIRILWVPTELFKLVHSQIVSVFFSLTHMPDSFICRTWRRSNWFKVLQPCLSVTTSFLPLAFLMAGETTLSILELKFLHRFFLTDSAMYFTDSCLCVPGWFISFIPRDSCDFAHSLWVMFKFLTQIFNNWHDLLTLDNCAVSCGFFEIASMTDENSSLRSDTAANALKIGNRKKP